MSSMSKFTFCLVIAAIGLGAQPLLLETGRHGAAAADQKKEKAAETGAKTSAVRTEKKDNEIIYCPGDPDCPKAGQLGAVKAGVMESQSKRIIIYCPGDPSCPK
jgi:hypothetical protein